MTSLERNVAPAWNLLESPAVLAETLAATVARALARAIDRRGVGFIAVSGGTTPRLFFQALSKQDIDWGKVIVTLVDERFVDRGSPRANAGLVRTNLLQDKALSARFVDLYQPGTDVEKAATAASETLASLPWPLDVAVLGMGTDGHTASFFPDAANLSVLLDLATRQIVLPVIAESAGEPRLTLPLARLVDAGLLLLHIEGAEKRQLLERGLAEALPLPICTVIDRARTQVQVFWAP